MEWQPIETARKDGTVVDLWIPDAGGGYRCPDCYWSVIDGYWRQVGDADTQCRFNDPTHWMSLPPPPAAEK